MTMNEIRYPYKPKVAIAVLVTLFFAGCGSALGFRAAGNDRGLIFYDVLELDPGNATIFFWCLAAASALMAAVGIAMFISGITSKMEIVLGEKEVTIPKGGLTPKTVTIPYQDITEMQMVKFHRQVILSITHRHGKVSVAQSLMPSKADFEAFVAELNKGSER